MNGTGHYDEAENLLDTIHIRDLDLDDETETEFKLRLAEVHASLALAGAVAALIGLTVRGNPVVVKVENASDLADTITREQIKSNQRNGALR